MAPTTIALLALAGFCAGLVDAIGGGGGLVTVPALLATGMPPAIALATNKGQASFGAISSFGSFWMRGGIDRKRVPLGLACGFLGSLAGARILLLIRPEPLRPVVIVLLLLAAAFLAWPRKPREGKPHAWAMLALAPIGLGLGFYDGFFGPGTGSMLIVAFVLVFGDTLTRASGNAKVVNLASNLAALAIFMWRGTILWEIAIPMAIANATGAFVGARLAVKNGDKLVRVVVLSVVAAVVLKMVYESRPLTVSSPSKVVFGLVLPANAAEAVAPRVDALTAWMSERSGFAVSRSDATSYEALAMAVREGKVDVAWLPPIVLVRLAEAVTALGSILRGGRTSYESALIVRSDSKIKTVSALRGQRAGWVDPWSAAGFVLPRVKMAGLGIDPRAAFRTEKFFGSHHAAIEALAAGACDVVGTYARLDESGEITRGAWNEVEGADVRVLASMGAIPPDVIAVRRNLLPHIHEKLLETLRAACADDDAQKMVKDIFGGHDLAEGLADGYDKLRQSLETAMAGGLFD